MGRVSSLSGGANPPLSFVARLAGSEAFKSLFREGMSLVEESARYLDGAGRDEAKALARSEALGYAAESMRLTTRLMQLASWLLLQRAVNEGEMTTNQAASEKHKVKLSTQEVASNPEIFSRLPERLRDLVAQSMRLQARIIHLDELLYTGAVPTPIIETVSPVAAQIEQLRHAFSN